MSNIADHQFDAEKQSAPQEKTTHSITTSDDDSKQKPEPERAASIRHYTRVFTYGTQRDTIVLAVGIVAAVASGVTQPLMFVVFGSFVDKFSDFTSGNTDEDTGSFHSVLDKLCLYVFALFIVRFGLASIHKFAFRMIGIRLSAAIRIHYLRQLFSQSIHALDSLPPGSAVGTITSTSNTLQIGISEKLSIFLESSALVLAAIIIAFTWSWELALVTSASFLAVILVIGALLPLTLKGQARKTKWDNEAASVASESFSGIRMIMACGAQRSIIEKFGAFVEEAKKEAQSVSPITSLQFALTFFGVFGTVALVFWYGTRAFTRGRVDDVGVITIVLLNLTTVFFSLERVSAPLQAIGNASLAASEFFSIIDAPLPIKGDLRAPAVSSTEDIIFDRVTFAYPSRPDVKILDELDLRIEAGKVTAIVGPSGSGKSTIVGLIEGWYSLKPQHVFSCALERQKKEGKKNTEMTKDHNGDATDVLDVENLRTEDAAQAVGVKGAIKTCGQSLDDIDIKWWRSQIGLVQQEPYLFNASIYENVAYGLVGSPWEQESVEHKRELVKSACQEAFADEFIDKLPKGYDTNVGDGGNLLSGGQRQRIAIARSIVKKPTILILDEATSSIDIRGERIVQAALERAAQNRTTVIIAHRLSTIKKADRIMVLNKGKLLESGTHDTLMALDGGVYAGLVEAQTLSLGASDQSIQDCPENQESNADIPWKSEGESDRGDEFHHAEENDDDEAKPTNRGFFPSFGLLFFESKPYWSIMCFSFITSAAAGAAMPLHAWMFSSTIGLFRYQDQHSKLMQEVVFMAGMWVVFAASAAIAYFLTFVSSGYVASILRAKYQKQYFESLVFQPAPYFNREGHSHGTLVSRIKDDPLKLEELMGMNMTMVFISIFNIIGGVVMALCYTWKLALVAMCVVMPICLFSGYTRFKYELQFENMGDEVFAQSSQFASESIGGFRTVTSLGLESSITNRFESLCHGHVIAAYEKARWISVVLGFSESASLACQALIFYYGGRLLTGGEIGITALFVCLMAMMSAAEGFGQSLSFGPNAAQATKASNRILDVRESCLMQGSHEAEPYSTDGGVEIELRNIQLRYPTQHVPILNNLSLTIKKGQFAALVGPSGCGKTSIISLLERFYEPDKGQILCNGVDIATVDIYNHRKSLSLVAQEPTLFQGTIRENVLLGINPDSIHDEQVHQTCQDASIHDFVVSLPEGYNTNIGSRGVSLSGGQKQRISIARALIRQPRLLLLDEATSSLDSENEKLVQAALERAAKGRTTLAVAHRLATIQNADVIFVMGEGGRVLEEGRHEDLLRKQGVYYQMCKNQALGS